MTVTLSRSHRALVITLDRPRKRNALDSAMIDAITSAVRDAGSDQSLAAVVVRGSGDHFCAGADINEYHEVPPARLLEFTVQARTMCETLSACPLPVIAAVRGVALGGGMELCLAADFVLADASASFGLPELRLGLIPGWGGTQRLPAMVGQQAARHLVFTSGRLDAHRAQALGLVAEVCPGDLDEELDQLLEVLAAQSRGALVAAKRALSAASTAEGPARETALLMERFQDPDGIEGVAAFVERRPPGFSDAAAQEESR